MATTSILNVASSAIGVLGTPTLTDGGRSVLHISATSYGTDGKVVLKGSSDDSVYTTLEDSATISGFAEYSADIILNLDKLAQGWWLRADLEISSGTATVVNVDMGTN